MKKISGLLFACICFLSLVLFGCARQEEAGRQQGGLRIVTSFYPVYSLVKEIAGDHHDVRMIGSNKGIHSFEPSPADIRAIYDADVFVYHSAILEGWAARLDPNLEGAEVQVLEATRGMDLMRVKGLEDVEVSEGQDASSLLDPHTWLDPILVGEEALVIAQLLSEVDPDHAETFKENAERIKQEAGELADRYASRFASVKHKTFVTQHTAFSYTASRFGLEQLGIAGVSEEEPSPRQLAEIRDFVEAYQVKTIFTEKGVSDKLARSLATSTGVELKVLDPLEADPQNGKPLLVNLEMVLETLADDLK